MLHASPTGFFFISISYTLIGMTSTPHAHPCFIPFTTRLISPHRTVLRDSGILAVSVTRDTSPIHTLWIMQRGVVKRLATKLGKRKRLCLSCMVDPRSGKDGHPDSLCSVVRVG